jgi:ferrous iron transport protein B
VDNAQEQRRAVAELENARRAEEMAWTVSGRIGHFLEPFMRPVGFDWHITTAAIGALAAKEVFVSQLGILFSQGETDENSQSLRSILVRTYTPLQGFCMMLFCLLSIPCLGTLAIIRRELNSWKMAILEGVGMFALAYIVTFIVYQGGMLLNIGTKMLG